MSAEEPPHISPRANVFWMMNTLGPFERCVQQHGATVLRVCRAALGPTADAEDAWSETFLSALKAWPTLTQETNVEAWLVRIAQNKTIDIIRTRQRQAVPTDRLPEPLRTWDEAILPDLAVWRLVAQLPARQRLAIAYHYLGGLPHTETAAVIGSTPDAVRRASADGIKALRSRLTTADDQKGATE